MYILWVGEDIANTLKDVCRYQRRCLYWNEVIYLFVARNSLPTPLVKVNHVFKSDRGLVHIKDGFLLVACKQALGGTQ